MVIPENNTLSLQYMSKDLGLLQIYHRLLNVRF